jgi:SAM-dependent methyltransferase
MAAAKWDKYHESGSPPWESGRPVSQFVAALASGAMPVTGTAMELGCGNGVSTIALVEAGQFTRVYGVDISEVALKRALAAADSLGQECIMQTAEAVANPQSDDSCGLRFVLADLLDPVQAAAWTGQCAAVFDCQFFHAVRHIKSPDQVAQTMAGFLAPGGRLLVLCGNASEPPRVVPGPTLLTREELMVPFERAGLTLVSLESTRFDSTPAYGAVPPLAWAAVFSKP